MNSLNKGSYMMHVRHILRLFTFYHRKMHRTELCSFGNRAAVYQKLERWEETVEDSKSAIDLDPNYLKAYRRRSIAAEKLSRWHEALEDLKKIIELDPECRSKESGRLAFLERRAQEQFEKDKDEMISKLKGLGNTVLGKFGMSLDNFKCEKDPGTGSYSVKYQS